MSFEGGDTGLVILIRQKGSKLSKTWRLADPDGACKLFKVRDHVLVMYVSILSA